MNGHTWECPRRHWDYRECNCATGRRDKALALLAEHQACLPPGFEDKCVCLGCEIGRALTAPNLTSTSSEHVVERNKP